MRQGSSIVSSITSYVGSSNQRIGMRCGKKEIKQSIFAVDIVYIENPK